jgi:hypothetical protein
MRDCVQEIYGLTKLTRTAVNDGEFRRAQKDFAAFIEELSPLVAEKDFTIPELPAKDIVSLVRHYLS